MWSKIWAWLRWMRLTHGPSRGCSQSVVQGYSHLKAHLRDDPPPRTLGWLVAGSLRSSLAVQRDISFLPNGRPHRAFQNTRILALFSQQWGIWGEESERRWERWNQSFGDLISKVTSQGFCHILLVRNKSLGPSYSQRDVITQEMHTRK